MALSPQVVLNCRAGGSCHGGTPGAVYEFAEKYGVRGTALSHLNEFFYIILTPPKIPDETCQPYDATDHEPVECVDNTIPNRMVCKVREGEKKDNLPKTNSGTPFGKGYTVVFEFRSKSLKSFKKRRRTFRKKKS